MNMNIVSERKGPGGTGTNAFLVAVPSSASFYVALDELS